MAVQSSLYNLTKSLKKNLFKNKNVREHFQPRGNGRSRFCHKIDLIKKIKLDLLFSDVEVWALSDVLCDVGGVRHRPWKWVHEGRNKVDQGPSDDHIVVGGDEEGGQDRGKSDSHESWVDSTEHSDISALELLSERQLHESDWKTNREEAEEVWNEEEGSSPLEAEVRETPEVSESDAVTNHSEDEGHSGQPSGTLAIHWLVFKEFVAAIFATHCKSFF